MKHGDGDPQQKRHPIQVVSRRSGLTQDLLRAWEKRYAVVEPGRSEGGRRLYSDADIERLRLLRRATLAGRRISDIAPLGDSELVVLVEEDQRQGAERPEAGEDGAAPEVYLSAALAAAGRFDAQELEAVLTRAMMTLGAPTLIEEVLAPLMREIGQNWEDGSMRPCHEHLVSAIVARLIGNLTEVIHTADESAPILVLATLSGQTHELGALFAAATAAAADWRIAYLGPNLPAEHIAEAASETEAQAVAVSLVYPKSDREIAAQLRELREALPAGTPILVGGAAAESYAATLDDIGALHLTALADLRAVLAELS
jgi:DNA-binding transcriptional MerR regulator/methylmalonyl-CoA mutase cobalamin-binding subunit